MSTTRLEKLGISAVALLILVSTISILFTEELIDGINVISGDVNDLPECSDNPPFDSNMFEAEDIESIIPLGNYNPPGHTFPTEHMYVIFNQSSSMKVYAPGDVKVTYLGVKKYSEAGKGNYNDYDITMHTCTDVNMHLMHMQLDPELIDKAGKESRCRSYETHNSEIEMCEYESSFWIDGGTLLGTAGNPQNEHYNFDMGVKDYRVTNDFIDKEVQGYFLNSVCPFQYFTDDIRQEMESLAGGWGDTGNVIDPCGEILFDIKGTAQGNWVKKYTPRNSETQYDEHGLGLYYDNIEQDKLVIASSSDGGYSYKYGPSETGLQNRSFSSVVADGNIYCYETGFYPNDIILIELIDDENLKIERVASANFSCSSSENLVFSNNAEIFVRYVTSPPDWYYDMDGERFIGKILPIFLFCGAAIISLILIFNRKGWFSIFKRQNDPPKKIIALPDQ
ncbi:MAG: hypothetical protein QF479_04550 [Candidatus Poseidoniaceae archaeon]|nr:hypothetical protein [Candidatus Poseidoniaceae archaeon]